MASDSDDPDGAAARLEAALERIAAAAARPPAPPPQAAPAEAAARPVDAELVTRLDKLIERLRGAVAAQPL